MLVLSRKKLERIQIAENITITVLNLRGDRVQLGIEAPPDVPIVRSELNNESTKDESWNR